MDSFFSLSFFPLHLEPLSWLSLSFSQRLFHFVMISPQFESSRILFFHLLIFPPLCSSFQGKNHLCKCRMWNMRREIEKTENREESTVCSLISVDEITLEKKVEDEIRGLVIQMIVIFPKSLLLPSWILMHGRCCLSRLILRDTLSWCLLIFHFIFESPTHSLSFQVEDVLKVHLVDVRESRFCKIWMSNVCKTRIQKKSLLM